MRPAVELELGVCQDCRDDADGVESLVGVVGDFAGAEGARAHLEELATALDDQLPFTAFGFGVLARETLALLAAVHPELDVAELSQELDNDTAHVDHNAGAMAAFIREQLARPRLRPAPARRLAGAR